MLILAGMNQFYTVEAIHVIVNEDVIVIVNEDVIVIANEDVIVNVNEDVIVIANVAYRVSKPSASITI